MPLPLEDEFLGNVIIRTARRAVLAPRAAANLALGQPIACHPQFPKHVLQFCANMLLPLSAWRRLVWRHTSYPLIAPFLEPHERNRLLCWMLGDCRKLGRPGSRLFTDILFKTYRFCPLCFEEQEKLFGERYWKREWQLPQIHICSVHNVPLLDTGIPFRDSNGISLTISPYAVSTGRVTKLCATNTDLLAITAIADLTNMPMPCPTREQWLAFYENLRCGRTDAEIDEAALAFWGAEWMAAHGIARATDLLRGRHWRAWWMHLTLGLALNWRLRMRDMIRLAASN